VILRAATTALEVAVAVGAVAWLVATWWVPEEDDNEHWRHCGGLRCSHRAG
jgi:hypothetical protein